MRKLILVFAVFTSVVLVSCKDQKATADKKGAATKEITQTKTDVNVPTFDNKQVGEYMKKYDSYIEEYKKIVNSKDMTKLQALGAKGQELAKQAQTLLTGKLSSGDTKKLQDYMQKKSVEMQEIAKKMMQK